MGGWTPVSPWKIGATQKLTTSASSARTTAFNSETRAVLIATTADCHIAVGALSANPVATAANMLVKAAWPPIIIGIDPTDGIAAIQDAGAGSVFITELTH